MLGLLPTDQSLLSTLRAALTSAQPARALAPLLTGSGTPSSLPVQPTRLLYTLEVCYAFTLCLLSCPCRLSKEVYLSDQFLISSVSFMTVSSSEIIELMILLHHAVTAGQVCYMMWLCAGLEQPSHPRSAAAGWTRGGSGRAAAYCAVIPVHRRALECIASCRGRLQGDRW